MTRGSPTRRSTRSHSSSSSDKGAAMVGEKVQHRPVTRASASGKAAKANADAPAKSGAAGKPIKTAKKETDNAIVADEEEKRTIEQLEEEKHESKRLKTEADVEYAEQGAMKAAAAEMLGKKAADVVHKTGSKTGESAASRMVEYGVIIYLARPKLKAESVSSPDDAKALYILLVPSDKNQLRKVLRVSKKVMPEQKKVHGEGTGRPQTFFAFVDAVGSDEDMVEALGAYDYNTKTYGERHVGAAEELARGAYGLYISKGRVTLTHILDDPAPGSEAADMRDDFNLNETGSYIIQVKNPKVDKDADSASFVGLSPERRASYSEETHRAAFHAKRARQEVDGEEVQELRFASGAPVVHMLAAAGTQVLLIAGKFDQEEFEHLREMSANIEKIKTPPLTGVKHDEA